jgi:hypothetical protein
LTLLALRPGLVVKIQSAQVVNIGSASTGTHDRAGQGQKYC